VADKAKVEAEKTIEFSRVIVQGLGEILTDVTFISNRMDSSVKVTTPAIEPDTVEDAMNSAKFMLSKLLDVFHVMITGLKQIMKNRRSIEDELALENGATVRELLEKVDDYLSDTVEGELSNARSCAYVCVRANERVTCECRCGPTPTLSFLLTLPPDLQI
jgi:hypothetical protein